MEKAQQIAPEVTEEVKEKVKEATAEAAAVLLPAREASERKMSFATRHHLELWGG